MLQFSMDMTLGVPVRNLLKTAALLLVVWLPLVQAGEDYLLTGVIAASGGGKAFAVIEQADGQQRLVSEGDVLGKGRVVAIYAEQKTVRLALPDGEILLTLRGSAHPVEQTEKYSIEDYNIEDYQEAQPSMQPLGEDAVQGLLELARQTQQLGEEKSRARLNKLLGLGSAASIAALNDERVDSTAQFLERMVVLLRKDGGGGDGVRSISVADDLGRRRIYLNTNSVSATR